MMNVTTTGPMLKSVGGITIHAEIYNATKYEKKAPIFSKDDAVLLIYQDIKEPLFLANDVVKIMGFSQEVNEIIVCNKAPVVYIVQSNPHMWFINIDGLYQILKYAKNQDLLDIVKLLIKLERKRLKHTNVSI